jgi:hypothetical protein
MSTDTDGSSGRSRLRPDHRVVLVHRIGAVIVALVIATFGVLGFVGGLGFFDTDGQPVLGLSSNGLLSTISVVTALVLIAAAARGGRFVSTVMMVIGALFLVSAFVNLFAIGTPRNYLGFSFPNVFFSIGAGLVLLILGAYGRLSASLPSDNPYRLERADQDEDGGNFTGQSGVADHDEQPRPRTHEEHRADREMADAARAVASATATGEQRRRLAAADAVRYHEDRRRVWMDSADDGSTGGADRTDAGAGSAHPGARAGDGSAMA